MVVELKHGDEWPNHYRGTKYHFNQAGEVYWSAPLKMVRVTCINGHEKIFEKLLKLKPTGGSFRVTEDRDVIAKKVEVEEDEDEKWPAFYVGHLDEDMEFEHIDINPSDIRHGDLWPAFYDGACYHYNAEGKIWWRDSYGRRYFVTTKHPDLVSDLLKWKCLGGSFRITENKQVIALLERLPYPEHIEVQILKMNDLQKSIIEYKQESTNMVPIFIGEFDVKFELSEPYDMEREWTGEETESLISKLRNLGRY